MLSFQEMIDVDQIPGKFSANSGGSEMCFKERKRRAEVDLDDETVENVPCEV